MVALIYGALPDLVRMMSPVRIWLRAPKNTAVSLDTSGFSLFRVSRLFLFFGFILSFNNAASSSNYVLSAPIPSVQ